MDTTFKPLITFPKSPILDVWQGFNNAAVQNINNLSSIV